MNWKNLNYLEDGLHRKIQSWEWVVEVIALAEAFVAGAFVVVPIKCFPMYPSMIDSGQNLVDCC